MLRRYRGGGIDPLAERIYTYPVLHYQNGGLVIDERRDDARGRPSGEIAGGTLGREPHDGQQPSGMHVSSPGGRAAAERAGA